MAEVFPDIRFRGELRRSQKDVSNIVRSQLHAGEDKFHLVAPPGSGKTVTGLFLWDVVCIAPEFAKGMDDYKRFRTNYKRLYGVTDAVHEKELLM